MTARSIPAITIWQPWATLIAEGLKQWEFRSWPAFPVYVGRRIAIHAGARPARRTEINALMTTLIYGDARSTGIADVPKALDLLEGAFTRPTRLPTRSVLCTAVLGRPVQNADLAAQIGVPLVNDSDREAHTNWGWPLTDVRRLEPFAPTQGRQGFWLWTPPDREVQRA